MAKEKRAAIYLRVSTGEQTVGNQRRELEAAAASRGWSVVAVYDEEGVSGAKGREGRPQLDLMLKDAVRRRFDVVMVWASIGSMWYLDQAGHVHTAEPSCTVPRSICSSISRAWTPRRHRAAQCSACWACSPNSSGR